jgi:hypothetical protein
MWPQLTDIFGKIGRPLAQLYLHAICGTAFRQLGRLNLHRTTASSPLAASHFSVTTGQVTPARFFNDIGEQRTSTPFARSRIIYQLE